MYFPPSGFYVLHIYTEGKRKSSLHLNKKGKGKNTLGPETIAWSITKTKKKFGRILHSINTLLIYRFL